MFSCPSCSFPNNEQARLCGYCGLYLRPIGDYQLISQIGIGGFAEVYRAINRYTGHHAAIKFLHRKLLDDKEIKQRFLREVEILRDLHSPNIVKIYDFGILDDIGMYLVMEWIDGETLDVYVHRQLQQRLPQTEALHLFSQLLYGLSRIHERRVVHRDLKPKNFMVVQEQGQSTLKILDFGIAWVSGSQALTERGMFVGSTYFMAPEQFRAQKDLFGPSTDLYVAGLLLVWMLTGKHVFTGSSIKDLAVQHCYNMPPMLSELCPEEHFLPALEGVIAYALQKQPDRRFQSAIEFLQAINHPLEFQRQFLQTNLFRSSASQAPNISLASASDPLTFSGLGNGSAHTPSYSTPLGTYHGVHDKSVPPMDGITPAGMVSSAARQAPLSALSLSSPHVSEVAESRLVLDEPVTTPQYATSSIKTDVMGEAQADLMIQVQSSQLSQNRNIHATPHRQESSLATPSSAILVPSSPPPPDAPHNVGPSSPPMEVPHDQLRVLSDLIASWPTTIIAAPELANIKKTSRSASSFRKNTATSGFSRSLTHRTGSNKRIWLWLGLLLTLATTGLVWWFQAYRQSVPLSTTSSPSGPLPSSPSLYLRPLHTKPTPLLKPSPYPQIDQKTSRLSRPSSAQTPKNRTVSGVSRSRRSPIPSHWRYPSVAP